MPSQHTLRIYEACIVKLKKEFNSTDLMFLADSASVINYIEALPLSDNSKKIYWIALKSTLRDLPDKSDELKAAETAYQTKMDAYNKIALEKMEKQELDEREKAIWLKWSEILKAREKAYETAEDINTYQDYVTLCLYTYLPPARLDYSPLRVVASEEEEPEGNILVVKPRSMEFVIRNYKTAGKYGALTVPVPPKLRTILTHWLELNITGWLLCTKDGDPLTESQLSSRIRAIFTRLTGKAAGVNILRHSYISHLRRGEPALKKQKEVAEAMGHSIGMSVLYRKQ